MAAMEKTVRVWRGARQGQAVVEYALIIVLIALVLFFAVKYFGLGVQHSLNNTALRVKKS
ncbi:MAG: hypothetical protein M0Z54_17035 [Thermaerobacter sp.]|nr:hypothetical protein [Thermaerobacter sp.]